MSSFLNSLPKPKHSSSSPLPVSSHPPTSTTLSLPGHSTTTKSLTPIPSPSPSQSNIDRTRSYLQQLSSTQSSKHSKQILSSKQLQTPKYIQYQPSPSTPGYNSSNATRIIRISQAPVDPMEPPKFSLKKAPLNAVPDDAIIAKTPVLHSNDEESRLTQEELKQWKVPPCVSRWKNVRGYTVSLDKRMGAYGVENESGEKNGNSRNRFEQFAGDLFEAERKARDDVNARGELQKKLAAEEKARKERELRKLAETARNLRNESENGSVMDSQRLERDSLREKMREEREFAVRQKQGRSLRKEIGEGGENELDVDERIYQKASNVGMSSGNMEMDVDESLYGGVPLFAGGARGRHENYAPSNAMKRRNAQDLLDGVGSRSGKDAVVVENPVEFEREYDEGRKNDEDEEQDPFGIEKMVANAQQNGEAELKPRKKQKR